MKIFFVLNPTRHEHDWDFRELAGQITRRYGWTARFGEIDRQNPPSLDRLLRQAAEEDCSRLGVLGGDGTLHQVVNVLQRQKQLKHLEIAPLPGGACNDFARYLGHSRKHLESALRTACTGRAVTVDLGLMDNDLFLNNAGIGRRPSGPIQKSTPGTRMARPLRTVQNFRPIALRAEWEKGSIEGLFYMALACNAPFFSGGLHFSRKTDFSDGLLDIHLLPQLPKWRLFTQLMIGRMGRRIQARELITLQVSRIKIEADTDLWPQADGEPPARPVRSVVFSISPEKAMIVR